MYNTLQQTMTCSWKRA